jgi:hypothetical protein
MISAKRIVTIFARRGGGGEFTKTADELTSSERARLQAELEGQAPLIASARSEDEWFALTETHIASKRPGAFRRVRLDEIAALISPAGGKGFERGKKDGGVVEVRLRDGSTVTVSTESGGPFVALTNAFLYLARVNRKYGAACTG